MKLSELQPKFLKVETDVLRRYVDTIQEADGIIFLCPVCWKKNKGPVGTESIICWKPSVPQTVGPKGGRWNLVGTGFHDLSLVAGSSSILIRNADKSEHWHGLIKNGEVSDC
jgi:hypothetical protein